MNIGVDAISTLFQQFVYYKLSYFYGSVPQISIYVFHFEPLNHTCAEDERLMAISENLTVAAVSWHCLLNFFFIFLQKTVVLYSISVLDIHMTVDYRKLLVLQTDIRFPVRKAYYLVLQSPSVYIFSMYFVLEDGSSHSLLALNTVRFSVKLFLMMLFFIQFIVDVSIFYIQCDYNSHQVVLGSLQ